jgi:hypothetical protein
MDQNKKASRSFVASVTERGLSCGGSWKIDSGLAWSGSLCVRLLVEWRAGDGNVVHPKRLRVGGGIRGQSEFDPIVVGDVRLRGEGLSCGIDHQGIILPNFDASLGVPGEYRFHLDGNPSPLGESHLGQTCRLEVGAGPIGATGVFRFQYQLLRTGDRQALPRWSLGRGLRSLSVGTRAYQKVRAPSLPWPCEQEVVDDNGAQAEDDFALGTILEGDGPVRPMGQGPLVV